MTIQVKTDGMISSIGGECTVRCISTVNRVSPLNDCCDCTDDEELSACPDNNLNGTDASPYHVWMKVPVSSSCDECDMCAGCTAIVKKKKVKNMSQLNFHSEYKLDVYLFSLIFTLLVKRRLQ